MPADKSRHRGRFSGTRAQRHWGLCTWICTRWHKICPRFFFSKCVLVSSLFSTHLYILFLAWGRRAVCQNSFIKNLHDLALFLMTRYFYKLCRSICGSSPKPCERIIFRLPVCCALENKFLRIRRLEERDEGCVKTFWTPRGIKRGNSIAACEAESEQPPPLHLAPCLCVLPRAYANVRFFHQSYQSATRLLMARE